MARFSGVGGGEIFSFNDPVNGHIVGPRAGIPPRRTRCAAILNDTNNNSNGGG